MLSLGPKIDWYDFFATQAGAPEHMGTWGLVPTKFQTNQGIYRDIQIRPQKMARFVIYDMKPPT